MRVILASNRAMLMERYISHRNFGKDNAGANLMEVYFALKEDRAWFSGAQELFALIISLGQAKVYVLTGLYDVPSDLGAGVCLLLIIRPVSAAFIITILDKLLQNGYGLSSGIQLFIATDICKSIMWKAFSPSTVNTGRGPELEGASEAFFHLLVAWNDKDRSLMEAFWRITECDESHRDYRHFRRCYLPARLPYRNPTQVKPILRTTQNFSRQAVLHFQRAPHAWVRVNIQHLHRLSNAHFSFP